MNVRFHVGDRVRPRFCGPSEVVGVDSYTMRNFLGEQLRWESYTLASASNVAPYDRWWLVNTPGLGAHVFTAVHAVPVPAVFVRELSGLVALASKGDARLSSDIGALATYRDDAGELFAEELFAGSERLVFHGRKHNSANFS